MYAYLRELLEVASASFRHGGSSKFRVAFDESWGALSERDLVHWNILEEVLLAEPSSIDRVYDVASLSAEVQISRVGDDCVV
jgi:hypothetical protein